MSLSDRLDTKAPVKLDELSLLKIQGAMLNSRLMESEFAHARRNVVEAEREYTAACSARDALVKTIADGLGVAITKETVINFDTGEIINPPAENK